MNEILEQVFSTFSKSQGSISIAARLKPDPNSLIFKSDMNSDSLSDFLKTFYNGGRNLLICPGTFCKSSAKSSGGYFFRKNRRGFRALVFLLQLQSIVFPLLYEFHTSKDSLWSQRNKVPTFRFVFKIFLYVLWIFVVVNFYAIFSRRGLELSEILNKVQAIQQLLQKAPVDPPNYNLMQFVSKSCITCVFVKACYTFALVQNRFLTQATIQGMLQEKVCGLQPETCEINTTTEVAISSNMEQVRIVGLSLGQFVLLVLILIGEFVAEIAAHFLQFNVLVHAFVFHRITSDFVRYLKRQPLNQKQGDEFDKENRQIALNVFEGICELSELLDEVIGSAVGFSCFGVITFYANLLQSVSSTGWPVIVQVFMYAITMGSFLFLSAEANSMLGYFVFWLQGNSNLCRCSSGDSGNRWDTYERTCLALNQLQRNQIGIRGRMFTVTYSFVGSMLSLLLSYSILLSQLNS